MAARRGEDSRPSVISKTISDPIGPISDLIVPDARCALLLKLEAEALMCLVH